MIFTLATQKMDKICFHFGQDMVQVTWEGLKGKEKGEENLPFPFHIPPFNL
jgi:hypothetical protein